MDPLQSSPATILYPFANGSRSSRTYVMHERRAVVRAQARTMVAERGIAGFKIRDLAERCQMSVQTLYNNFCSRDAILQSAVSEYLESTIRLALQQARELDLPVIFVIGEYTKDCVMRNFSFMRELILCVEGDHASTIGKLIVDSSFGYHLKAMQAAQAANCLRAWTDPANSAKTVHNTMVSMLKCLVSDQSAVCTDAGEGFSEAIGMSLLGALQGRLANNLEHYLAERSSPRTIWP